MYIEKDFKKILYWLDRPHLFFSPIANGHYGMVYRQGGGVAIYLSKKALNRLVQLGYLAKGCYNKYYITMKGDKLMRGTVAKRLRKEAYIDRSVKVKQYSGIKHKKEKKMKNKDGVDEVYVINITTIICVGDRAEYLKLKKAYKEVG